MKKLFILMAIAVFAAGCNYNDATPDSQVVYLDAPWNDWSFNGYEYEIEFTMPEITRAVCDEGTVTATVVFDDGYQSEFPYVRHYQSPVDPNYTWTVTINSAYTRGKMLFFAAFSDFLYDPDNHYDSYEPGDWTFRVVVTEPY